MYKFFIGGMLLPVAPGQLKIKVGGRNTVLDLINEGEVNVAMTPALREYSFSFLLPNRQYPFAVYQDGFKPASFYLDQLAAWFAAGQVLGFEVFRVGDDELRVAMETHIDVLIESYNVTEDAADGGDFEVELELKEYRQYATKVLTTNGSSGTLTATADRSTAGKQTGGSYTVKSGDSLWRIAKVQLGDESKRFSLYQLNKATIEAAAKAHGRKSSGEGNLIYPGTVLTLPSA